MSVVPEWSVIPLADPNPDLSTCNLNLPSLHHSLIGLRQLPGDGKLRRRLEPGFTRFSTLEKLGDEGNRISRLSSETPCSGALLAGLLSESKFDRPGLQLMGPT